MAKLIEMANNNYVDASLVCQVSVSGTTVIVFCGRDPLSAKREQIACSSEDAAVDLARRIVEDANSANQVQVTLGGNAQQQGGKHHGK